MTWTHIPAQDDMFAVVEQVRRLGLGGAITTRKILKLILGGNLLETIDLHDLMFQARLDEERAGSQSLQDSDPRVVLIIKRPLVALRYQLFDSQIRRLQLKFKSDLAYDAMVGLFESLGFQITDRNSSELPNYPQVSSQPQYAGLSTSISQDRHPSAPVISSNPVTGPLSLPDSIPRATTSSGAEIRPTSSAPELCSVRPFTAPLSLSQMLPPKRDLPFPPKQKKVATSSSEMAPASFLVDSQEAARNPVAIDLNKISTATTNGANVLPFKTLANIAENPQNSVQPPGSTSALPDPDMIDVPRTPEVPQTVPEPGSTPTLPVKNAAKPRRKPASKPKKVIEPSTNPKPHPGSSKTLNKAPNVFEDVEPAEFMARLDGWVREYQHLPAPRPRAATSENLAAYAAQSKEERMMIIDDMICECLGDENFVKLAEDVGESWRRIGLGF